MHLAPTPEQREIQDGARRFLAEQLTRERRSAWDATAEGCDAEFWRAVAGLGWLGYGLPRAVGGQGASLLDVGLLLEEVGRAVGPMSIFAAITGGLALAALGSAAQRTQWLPGVAAGETLVTLAIAEREAALVPTAFTTTVKRRGKQLRLAGEKRYVLQGVTADAFLVAARDGRGVSVVLVPADAPGVCVANHSAFGKDRQSTLSMRDVVLPATALVGTAGAMWPRLEQLRRRFAALLCADLIGGCEAVLDMTVKYMGEREQFGVKLGTFQAVQQMCAVMAIDLEGARHLTRQALWRLANRRTADREVAIAKAWTARAYRDITLTAHQLHGGAGYVLEHELHRYTLRAKAAELLFGSTEDWMEDLADQLALAPSGTR
ncbi:MAG: acyl-CoA dehydrogenase family protein [Candidatus Binatia bacterium]